ncbi:Aminotransferase, class IV [metagenome]|uniref:Aminotransferase, class IV n=1 Tax=metagenome TaxID=256318 RepID=A0A2P2CEL9_9ZZZZ
MSARYADAMRAWINGQTLDDASQPSIAVTDHGFTVGDGVFEAVKVVDNVPFALTRHLRRLQTSAHALGLPEVDLDAVRRGIDATLADQDLPLGRIRITITGGPAPLGSGRGSEPNTIAVVAAPAVAPAPTTSLATFPYPRNERGVLAGVKTTSYAENVIALAHAAERGAAEALFVNLAGNLCEGTGSNVFYVVDGELRTPTLASGCLAGVTRALLVDWCDVREVDEPASVLEDATEIFLASTIRDVQGVHQLDDRQFVAPGPVTIEAMATWGLRAAESPDP